MTENKNKMRKLDVNYGTLTKEEITKFKIPNKQLTGNKFTWYRNYCRNIVLCGVTDEPHIDPQLMYKDLGNFI